MTVIEAATSTTPREADTNEPKPVGMGRIVITTLSTAYVLGVAYWLGDFWSLMREAAPVLDFFRDQHGAPMGFDDWRASGAVEVFCPHQGADPASNIIGRHIDAGSVYAPALALGGLASFAGGGVLVMLNSAIGGRLHVGLARAMALIWIGATIIVVWYASDISALTAINE